MGLTKTTNDVGTDPAEPADPADMTIEKESEENETTAPNEIAPLNDGRIITIDSGITDDCTEMTGPTPPTNPRGNEKLAELLPKLPSMANGMVLMGVPELNPLHKSGEVYKMRIARPDFPLGYSEAWDDRTTLRMTNFSKLVSEEVQMSSFRIEIASLAPGVKDDDMVGTQGIKGLYRATDVCTLTLGPFVQRKITGKNRSLTIYQNNYRNFQRWLVSQLRSVSRR